MIAFYASLPTPAGEAVLELPLFLEAERMVHSLPLRVADLALHWEWP
jgi:hypothetical protein